MLPFNEVTQQLGLIFEVCSTGFYGINCSEQCNNNCNETTKCDRFTGDCDGGCEPGWTAITCDDGGYL